MHIIKKNKDVIKKTISLFFLNYPLYNNVNTDGENIMRLNFFSLYRKRIEKKIKEHILESLDYKLIYESYKKYALNIIKEVQEEITFEKSIEPQISIVIPVYNNYDLTLKCLYSIKENCNLKNYEIIIVDDCSTDKTKELENIIKNIKIIKNNQNLGFLKSCNLGVKESKGKYIYLLNNDTQIMPHCIEKLAETLDKYNDCGAVGSKLIYPSGKLQEAGALIVSSRGKVISIGHKDIPLRKEFNNLREVDSCCGASLMIRKSLWEELNGFDEIYSPGYYEETDLCLKIKDKGYKILYQPESEVIHFESQTFSNKRTKLMKRNRKFFRNKWNKKLKEIARHNQETENSINEI